MRALLLTSLLLMGILAGCLSPDDDLGAGTDSEPEGSEEDKQEERARFLEDAPTFCDSEDGCDFWDDMYHQYVVYDLDTVEFDVIVVPSATADTLSHTEVARQAVEAWGDGILALAEPWLADAFRMDVYVAGVDVIPPDVLADPEIVVLLGGVVPTWLAGIGLEPKQFTCIILEEFPNNSPPGSPHHGWQRQKADCTGIGFTCFAINAVGVIGDEMDLYDLVAHEVGHCLGAGHVGDALDFRSQYVPIMDIMSYHFDPDHVGCVSNMNVRVLEGVYGHLLDRPEEMWLPRGSFYEFDPLDYQQFECENPPSALA